MFIDDFTDWIGERIMTYDNIIITGDFNLHVNEVEDPEIQVFNNTITALGFNQVVDFETHKKGNHLDLILVEELSKLKIVKCVPGPYLSDHCTVETVLTQNREDMLRKSVTNRKLHNIDKQQFITDLKLQDLDLIQQPDQLVDTFEDRLRTTLDKHAPEKTKDITIRSTNPWFTNEVKEKKRVVRRREKIW